MIFLGMLASMDEDESIDDAMEDFLADPQRGESIENEQVMRSLQDLHDEMEKYGRQMKRSEDNEEDEGHGGVREPLRPLFPQGSGSAAVELPETGT